MHPPIEIEFSKSWANEGQGWAIECGDWNFRTMSALLDYYGIKKYWGVRWDFYTDFGKQKSCIVYHGIANKNLDKETAYKNHLNQTT